MKKRIFLVLSLVLVLSLLTSCGYFSDADYLSGEKETDELFDTVGNQYAHNPAFEGIPRNAQCAMSAEFVQHEATFVPQSNPSGYVTNAIVSFEAFGYDLDFTYFNVSVIVTWTYNEISDQNMGGVDKTYTAEIAINPTGDAYYTNQLAFEGCRDVQLVSVDYQWSGTATRK